MIPLKKQGRAAVLAIALAWGASATADARVQVEAHGTVIHVSAVIDTGVDRETAWRVLTDYDRWSGFVPDLQVCRVVSRAPLRLEQRGRIPQLPNFPLVMITQVEETPLKGLRFQRIAGNVKTLVGEWQIHGKSPVRLVYWSIVEPGFPVPPQLSVEIFRHDAKVRLEAMAREMARQAAASR